jgi:heme/copper-type cytochrome/quinol oxidase subunit 1
MSSSSRAERVALIALPIVGAAAIVVGILITRSSPPMSFGWFAYAPLSDVTFAPGLAAQFWVGPGFVGVGIALLAGWAGFLLGRRRRG